MGLVNSDQMSASTCMWELEVRYGHPKVATGVQASIGGDGLEDCSMSTQGVTG